MKALTICQPYAHLIVTPQSELPRFAVQKRVENRTWNCRYRGPLLIHAGKSKKFLSTDPDDFDEYEDRLVFGAIVGVAEVVDCVPGNMLREKPFRFDVYDRKKYPWLGDHPHAEGPWCIILDNVQRFRNPVPYRGALGLFNVDGELVTDELWDSLEI